MDRECLVFICSLELLAVWECLVSICSQELLVAADVGVFGFRNTPLVLSMCSILQLLLIPELP